jgi:hypothetical protein
MHFYSTENQRQQPLSSAGRSRRRAVSVSVCALLAIAGCSQQADELELNPRAWAPPTVAREWSPAGSQMRVSSATEVAALSERPSSGTGAHIWIDRVDKFCAREKSGNAERVGVGPRRGGGSGQSACLFLSYGQRAER